MTLKDDFKNAIEAARVNERRRRRETQPPEEWWKEIRDGEITSALKEAAAALRETKIGGEYQPKNGGSGIVLLAGSSERQHHLTFTHSAGTILVTSSDDALKESWDSRPHVTAENIAAKIQAFLEFVAIDYLEPRAANGGPVQLGWMS